MHILHTGPGLCANKHTHKYTERHWETAAPYEAGLLWGLKRSLRVRGASERYGGAGSFEELISLTTLDTALFHSVHFIMTSWHHRSLSLCVCVSLSPVSACDPSALHLRARFSPLCVDPYGSWRARTMYDRPRTAEQILSRAYFWVGKWKESCGTTETKNGEAEINARFSELSWRNGVSYALSQMFLPKCLRRSLGHKEDNCWLIEI